VHYVPNVAKRSIWPYHRKGSSDPLHVWFYGGVFGVGRSNGAISGLTKSKMAVPPAWKLQMAISPTDHPIHSVFGARVEFLGSADRMALFPV